MTGKILFQFKQFLDLKVEADLVDLDGVYFPFRKIGSGELVSYDM